MIKYSCLALFLFCFIKPVMAENNHAAQPLIVLDEAQGALLPHHFRSSQWHSSLEALPFSLAGLDLLRASASGQFSEHSLKNIIKVLRPESLHGILIIDLRQESHGFINGLPISWYGGQNSDNSNQPQHALADIETQRLKSLSKRHRIPVHLYAEKTQGTIIDHGQTFYLKPRKIETEQQLTKRLGLSYERFYIQDHNRPSDTEIDRFVHLCLTLPAEHRIHFHCRKGWGRSTTFMVLLDIIRNGSRVSLEDIIARQTWLGGRDLFSISGLPDKEWKKAQMLERKAMVEAFYQYRQDLIHFPSTPWSLWRKKLAKPA